MKKAILVVLVAMATMAFAACGNSNELGQETGEQNGDAVVAAANLGETVVTPAIAGEPQAAPDSQPELDVDLAPAFANLVSEAAHRLNATPFQAFSMLVDSLRHGTTNIDVSYGGPFGIRVEANLATNSQTQQHHTQLGLNYMGFVRIDADVFATPDSLAIRVPIFDNNFYGVTFSTLEDDIPTFLSSIGIELNDFGSIFEGLDMFLGDTGFEMDALDSLEMFEPYVDVFMQFIDAFNVIGEETEHAGVSVTRYDFSFTMQDLYDFVENLYDVIMADADMLMYLTMADVTVSDIAFMFEDILDGILWGIDDLENSGVAMAVYVCQNDRLMYLELQARESLTSVLTIFTADFGASVYCDWVLSVESGTFIWSFSDVGNTYTNLITMTMLDSWTNQYETVTLSSVWSTETGEFTLSLVDDFDGTVAELRGQLIREANGGFSLRFAEGELEIIISGAPGTPNIPQINVINIDQWDVELVEDVLDFVFGLMMIVG